MGEKLLKKKSLGRAQKSRKIKGGFNKQPFVEEEFYKHLSENFLSKRTVKEYIKYVKCFFTEHREFNEETVRKFLNKHNRMYALSALKWYADFSKKSIKLPKKLKEPQKDLSKKEYTREELEQFLTSGDFGKLGKTEKVILKVLFFTGKRITETLYLKADDLQEGFIIFKMKGGYHQKLHIPDGLSEKLHELAKNTYLYGDLFYPNINHKYHKFRNALDNAGLSELKRTHNFRRAMINYLIEKADVLTAKDFIGHRKYETTMRYISEKSKEERISKAFNIIAGKND